MLKVIFIMFNLVIPFIIGWIGATLLIRSTPTPLMVVVAVIVVGCLGFSVSVIGSVISRYF